MINVKNMTIKDYVHLAISDMILNLDHVSSLNLIMLDLLILDVLIGIGITINVLHVLIGIISMLKESVFQLVTSAMLMIQLLDNVLTVSKDLLLIKEFVLLQVPLDHLTLDVEHGIGITKFVFLALKIGL